MGAQMQRGRVCGCVLLISSLCFHRIGNRHTFGTAFGRDPSHPRLRARHRAMIVDAVLRFVRKDD